eukprot:7847686-Lingulodinium_polyedra.AAC.1
MACVRKPRVHHVCGARAVCSRVPRAGRKLVCAWSARACDLRAAAAANGRSDRVVVQRFTSVAQ